MSKNPFVGGRQTNEFEEYITKFDGFICCGFDPQLGRNTLLMEITTSIPDLIARCEYDLSNYEIQLIDTELRGYFDQF